jgi:hypothetical protein
MVFRFLPLPKPAARLLPILPAAAFLAGCKPFSVDLGTPEPIKLDPVNINVRMDVYQHSSDKVGDGKKEEEDAKGARERIYNRQQQVQEMKNNRWVVETHRGELQVREKPAGKDGDWVEKTVTDENHDRKLLMQLRAKELNVDLHEVQNQFWKDNVEKSYKGEWIEIEDPTRPKMYKQVQKETDPAAKPQ